MTFKTRAIILRTIKYGETSLVVTAFTERFGTQTYMVNGVRTAKQNGGKAAQLQPGAILALDVYHQPLKNMQRIREQNWGYLYGHIFSHVVKNSIAMFMLELMAHTIRQPEPHADLYAFCEESLVSLDKAETTVAANFALFFSLHLAHFFGHRIYEGGAPNGNGQTMYLDLADGCFTPDRPEHPHYLEPEAAAITADLLKVMQPSELIQIPLNRQMRHYLLQKYLEFYALHIPEFGQMKSLNVLKEVLG